MKYKYAKVSAFSKEELDTFLSEIEKDKQNQIRQYKNNNRKAQSILGEKLLKDFLKEEDIPYTKCIFSTNQNGKRSIDNYPVFFNISHSFDIVICCMDTNPIGIDIEKIRPFSKHSLHFIANEKEQDYIQGDPKRHFEIYTQKEAAIKMMGLSLAYIKDIQLDNLYVHSYFDIDNYVYSICSMLK